jgi:hypothetical protein
MGAPSFTAGGSATGLSATDAYGTEPLPVIIKIAPLNKKYLAADQKMKTKVKSEDRKTDCRGYIACCFALL